MIIVRHVDNAERTHTKIEVGDWQTAETKKPRIAGL